MMRWSNLPPKVREVREVGRERIGRLKLQPMVSLVIVEGRFRIG